VLHKVVAIVRVLKDRGLADIFDSPVLKAKCCLHRPVKRSVCAEQRAQACDRPDAGDTSAFDGVRGSQTRNGIYGVDKVW